MCKGENSFIMAPIRNKKYSYFNIHIFKTLLILIVKSDKYYAPHSLFLINGNLSYIYFGAWLNSYFKTVIFNHFPFITQ